MSFLRRALLSAAVLLASAGCSAPFVEPPAYAAFAPREAPRLTSAPASPEADAVVDAFYRDDSGKDQTAVIDAALAKAPSHPGLHEIAAYQALLRADPHAAFEHFFALASDKNAVSPELAIWEMSQTAETVSEHLKEKALLELYAREHPKPAVRAAAVYALAREVRLFRGDTTQLGEIGFIRSWRLIGPFDNDQGRGFSTVYPPESSTDRAAEVPGLLVPVKFRPIGTKFDDTLDLGSAVLPGEAVAYLEAAVVTTAPRTVELRLTSSAAVRVWVGGKLVASEEKLYAGELDNVIAKVDLPAGSTRILVKTAHRSGSWRLGARITEVGGALATGLSFEAPSSPGPVLTEPATPPLASTTWRAELDGVSSPNRKSFLLGRLAARRGHTKQPISFYEPFLAAAPHHPLATYFAATAYWDLGEAGKTLDLLNRGVAAYAFAPGFLLKRGRFYAQKRLWDKARSDLEAALAKNPKAREAEVALASVDESRGWSLDKCALLERSLAKWPDFAAMEVDLGECYEGRGAFPDALRHYRRAAAIMPGFEPALRELLDAARRRPDRAEALELVAALRKIAPTSLAYALEEAGVLDEFGRRADARRVLERATESAPLAARPYERLGDLAFEDGDRARAVEHYRAALARDPQDSRLAERVDALSPETRSLADRLAATDDDIERAIDSASKLTVHPGSHYAVLLDDDVTQVNADGSSQRFVTIVRQALNEDGRDGLIQAKLPSYGRVRVLDAYSIKRGAERQEASSVTGSLVRFRSLDVGSIVVLRYVHYAPSGRFLPNEFATEWLFQSVNAQTERARFRLILGKGRELRVAVQGDVKSTTETIDGQEVRGFTAEHVPPLVTEPSMPSSRESLAMVSVSTLGDWAPYVRWERALLADATGDSSDIKTLAKELTADAPTPRQKLDRLWAYVAQEIRYQQEYEDTVAGVKPHPPRVVLERGYGDCKDKAMLLLYLAKAVGIELRFALLKTTPAGKIQKDIPNQQFNHAIDYVPKQPGFDQGFFIDSTTNGLDVGNLRGDDQGATSLVLTDQDKGYEFLEIPYQPTDVEYEHHEVSIDLRDPSHAAATDHLEVRGGGAAGLRGAVRNGEGARKTYQALSEHIFPGTTLVSGKSDHAQDILKPLEIDLETNVENAVQEDGSERRFVVPLQFPLARAAVLGARKLPLVLDRGEMRADVTMELSGQALRKPQSFDVEHSCFSVTRTVREKGSKLTVSTTYKVSCARVDPSDYPAFRAAVQKVLAHAQDSVAFRAALTKGSLSASRAH